MPNVMLLTKANRKALPALRSQDGKGWDAIAYVKFFTPDAQWTWYATEFDGKNTFFGLVVGLETELGYFYLSELEKVRGKWGMRVERDRWFKPTPLKNLKDAKKFEPIWELEPKPEVKPYSREEYLKLHWNEYPYLAANDLDRAKRIDIYAWYHRYMTYMVESEVIRLWSTMLHLNRDAHPQEMKDVLSDPHIRLIFNSRTQLQTLNAKVIKYLVDAVLAAIGDNCTFDQMFNKFSEEFKLHANEGAEL